MKIDFKNNTNKRFRIISICFYKKNESIFYKKYENQPQTPKTKPTKPPPTPTPDPRPPTPDPRPL